VAAAATKDSSVSACVKACAEDYDEGPKVVGCNIECRYGSYLCSEGQLPARCRGVVNQKPPSGIKPLCCDRDLRCR
jgi:hypothetical protein